MVFHDARLLVLYFRISIASSKKDIATQNPNRMQFLVAPLLFNLLVLLAMSGRDVSTHDILQLDCHALSKELAEGRVTAEEVMLATLDRIDGVNVKYKAIVAIRDRDELLEEARLCDQKLQSTVASNPKKGRLLGIPIAIKDLSDVAGLPTTMGGSWLFRFHYPKISDRFAKNIVDEGAIVIGKTAAPELGVGSHTFSKRWGTTVNPYDETKSAGGSSGGAAVALATRILCLADGSDMMGSLRNPGGWNNCYSHRPTAGIVPENENPDAPNVNPLAYPISTPGPMARTPRDLALLLNIMAGTSNFDAQTFEDKPNIKGMKIAWLGDWGGAIPVEDGILPLCRNALTSFEKKGATIHDIKEPVFEIKELWKSWTTIRSKVIAANFNYPNVLLRAFLLVAPMRQELKWEVRRGMKISQEDCRQAGDIAKQWSSCLEQLFSEYDALALPTAQTWPFPAEWRWPQHIEQSEMTSYHKWMEIAVPGSLAGIPCATIPSGFGQDGLPMGIQLLGRRGDDAKLLNLAQAYHTVVDWPNERQPTLS